MEDGRKHIQIKRRTQAEIESYQEGFNAGVQMCLDAISDNYARYRKMVQGVLVEMTMESERRQCRECIHFFVDSNFATDFCMKHEKSANSYDDACVDFEERVEG